MSKKVTYAGENSTSFQTKVLVKSIFIYIALILLTLICLIPIWILVVNATRSHAEIIGGVSLIPRLSFFDNLNTLKTNVLYTPFFHPIRGMFNSLIIAGSCCALTVFFSGLTAYGLVVYDFKAKGPMFTFILAVMMVPSQVTAVGFMKMLVSLDLLDSYIPLILPSIAAPAIVFFMRQYMKSSFPLEIVEAARIDGSNEFRTFFTIGIPMMKPAFAVQAIFSFTASWNNYFMPALILDKAEMKTVPIMIAQLRSADYGKFDMGKVYMFILLAILPVMIVYMCLSKYIIKGVTAGSVKG